MHTDVVYDTVAPPEWLANTVAEYLDEPEPEETQAVFPLGIV